MMRGLLFFFYLVLPTLIFSQTDYHVRGYKDVDDKYLKGAVSEKNNRVVFQYTIPLWEQSPTDVFEKLVSWDHKFSTHTEISQLYVDSTKRELALSFKDKLWFKSSVAYTDESDISFNLLFKVYDSYCELTVQNIKYDYIEAQKPVHETAENMITDRVALDKQGNLARYYDKFRLHTLDYIWDVRNFVEKISGIDVVDNMDNFHKIEKIPANFTNIMLSDLTLLTYNKNGVKDIRVKNGEVESSSTITKLALEADTSLGVGDVFTVSFYTEVYREKLDKKELSRLRTSNGGFSYSEAWMIVECKLLSSETEGKLVGEVLSVWSK